MPQSSTTRKTLSLGQAARVTFFPENEGLVMIYRKSEIRPCRSFRRSLALLLHHPANMTLEPRLLAASAFIQTAVPTLYSQSRSFVAAYDPPGNQNGFLIDDNSNFSASGANVASQEQNVDPFGNTYSSNGMITNQVFGPTANAGSNGAQVIINVTQASSDSVAGAANTIVTADQGTTTSTSSGGDPFAPAAITYAVGDTSSSPPANETVTITFSASYLTLGEQGPRDGLYFALAAGPLAVGWTGTTFAVADGTGTGVIENADVPGHSTVNYTSTFNVPTGTVIGVAYGSQMTTGAFAPQVGTGEGPFTIQAQGNFAFTFEMATA